MIELARQLGHDDFDRRLAAEAALVALGPPVVPAVELRLREVRRRVASGGPARDRPPDAADPAAGAAASGRVTLGGPVATGR